MYKQMQQAQGAVSLY